MWLVHFWWWFQNFTGTNITPAQVSNGGSHQYNFWSGFGSDISELLILGGIIQLYRKHNCHVKGCWRVGKYPVEGTPYIVCKKHHPATPSGDITMAHIKFLHRKHKEG